MIEQHYLIELAYWSKQASVSNRWYLGYKWDAENRKLTPKELDKTIIKRDLRKSELDKALNRIREILEII